MRKINTLICFIILLIGASCEQHKSILPDHVVCRCILSPTGTRYDTYLIEVNDSGIIRTSFGRRPDTVLHMITGDMMLANCHIPLVEKVEKQEERSLSAKDYKHLLNLLSQTKGLKCENPYVEGWSWDAWMVVLMTERQQFIYEEGDHSGENFELVVKELINLSPIPVSFDQLVGGIERIEPGDTLLYQDFRKND
jgi:hypothetical protein